MNIKIVQLNNKSRKGTYVYIKEKGKPSRYYKYDYKNKIDSYRDYYKDRFVENKKVKLSSYTKKKRSDSEKYMKKVSKGKKIKEIIKKGITETKKQNLFSLTRNNIIKMKSDMLKDLVIDKKILKQLLTEENFKKIKHRIEYLIEFRDEKQLLGTTSIMGETPEKVIELLNKSVKKGERIKKSETPTLARKLSLYGFRSLHRENDGVVTKVLIKAVFRKG